MTTAPRAAVQVRRLHKLFGDVAAVRDVTFTIHYGEIYGLLGPNGAGKTTTFSMIAGIYRPTSGDIFIDGEPFSPASRDLKARLGIVPQEITLFPNLTPLENLLYFAGLYAMSPKAAKTRALELLEWMELLEKHRTPVDKLSGGMKRRVNYLCGIIHHPSVLLLDEPTVGIDVQTRLMILDKTRELARNGMAVLYTTHYMEEAEKLCDRIGILDHGRLLMEGTLEELHRRVQSPVVLAVRGEFSAREAEPALAALSAPHRVLLTESGRLVIGLEDAHTVMSVLDELRAGLVVKEIAVRPPSLENLFIQLTGRELRE